ncbi:MAG: stage V sporulation protein AD [Bacilli bacterium]|jgi:stage V sporulation protein AD|nr:stage V sporulation protein AD [Bacilli bacterium]MCX4254692.1 stage V sporulation protein AD [Bacilli bacterium]
MASKRFNNVYIKDNFSVVGPLEKDGLLKNYDLVMDDYYYGEKTFEQAEIKMQKVVVDNLLAHNKLTDSKIDALIGGDLVNQISISSYNAAKYRIPYLGVYSACASYAEELIIGAALISGKLAKNIVCVTSSHNLNAERQFRYPVEYGAVKKHTTTFTTTAAIATLLTSDMTSIKLESATIGKVIDMGVKDTNNMGAVMAPAAADVLNTHLLEMKRNINYYDIILTGDLGRVGKEIFTEMLDKVYNLRIKKYMDAGCEIYTNNQETYAGASGPVALPLVLFEKVLSCKKYKKILVIATGSLQSVQLANQKLGIPGIAHAISLEVM